MYVLTKIRKCTIAFLTAMFVALCSMHASLECVSAAGITVANTSQVYYAYNTLGLHVYNYTLNAVSTPTNVNTLAMIGTEDRYADNSKSGVVKIICNDNDASFGTGFIVDSHTIATAAHCIYDYSTDTAKPIYQILIFNSTGGVAKTITSYREVHVPKSYKDTEDRFTTVGGQLVGHTNEYDYALIKVSEDLSAYECFNFGTIMDGASNTTISATGFPEYIFNADLNMTEPEQHIYHMNDFMLHNKMTGSGTITSISQRTFSTDVDASGGNSGSPVYTTTSYGGNSYYTVVGIMIQSHVSVDENTGLLVGTSNTCIRLTTDFLHFALNNPNI